jgi:hypothetical protein
VLAIAQKLLANTLSWIQIKEGGERAERRFSKTLENHVGYTAAFVDLQCVVFLLIHNQRGQIANHM